MTDKPTNPDMRSLHQVLMQATEEVNKAATEPARKPSEKVVQLSSQVNVAALEDIKSGAERFRAIIDGAVNDATAHVTDDLTKLVQEIEAIREYSIERATVAKAALMEHFDWGTEAALFAETIRTRMAMFEQQPEEKQAPQEQPPARRVDHERS